MENKFWLFVGVVLSCCTAAQANQSHSYFVPRQVTTNSIFELGLNNYDWYHRRHAEDSDDRSYYFSAYATPFFQQSTRAKKLSQYFLRCNSECLTFNEINHDTNAIESLWFGAMSDLDTNLSSNFSMRPRHRAYGSYFNLSLAKEWEQSALWCNLSFAAMGVEHELRMCETLSQQNGPLSNFDLGTISSSDTIIAALNNSEWNNGRFCPGTLKKGGVDDIQLKIGYDRYFENEQSYNHVSPYFVATIPTGERQRSLFVFEPIVGSNNWSVGFGLNADYRFYNNDRDSVTWLVDIKYRYVFGKDQCRTFDLCANGDWSRYLLVVAQDQVVNRIYGVNFFTINAHVTPKSTIDFWTALHWEHDAWNVELGYDFWWRQKEVISCKSSLTKDHGIFDLAGSNAVPLSASTANISQGPLSPNQAESDSAFVKIRNSDLDLDSAAHPTALSSTIYAAADYAFDTQCPTMIGIGMQYEFAHRIAALEQWGIWAKIGMIF